MRRLREDIFLTHVAAEFSVINTMLCDVDRRREHYGVRIASKDIENCLEDTVSIFEAALGVLVRRYLISRQTPTEDIERLFRKEIRNGFQSITRSQNIFRGQLDIELFSSLSQDEFNRLHKTFEKRHPITHNLGIVDRKYLEKARTAEREGREVFVTVTEVSDAIELSVRTFGSLHDRLLASANRST